MQFLPACTKFLPGCVNAFRTAPVNTGQAGSTWRTRFQALASGIALSAMLFTSYTAADDTEIFFAQVSTDGAEAANSPNIMFVLDDSHSMLSFDGTSESRLTRLKTAMYEILNTAENVNIGITTMNGEHGGGAIRYPVTAIDKPLCVDGSCYIEEIHSVINDVNDDTEELADESMVPGGLHLSSDSDRIVGLRFGDIGIPQGATITSAVLELNASQQDTSSASFTVHAHDSDDADAFTAENGNLSDRLKTTNSANFSAGSWSAGNNYEYDHVDISSIIKELVDRPGWCAGASVALLLSSSSNRSINSLENVLESGEGSAASLRITYDASQLDFTEQRCYFDTLSLHATGGNGDAEQSLTTGVVNRDWARVHIPSRNNDPIIYGLRFPKLQLPRNTVIEEARVEFTIGGAGSGTPKVKISASALNSPGNIGTGNSFISNLVQTNANVAWEIPSIDTVGEKIVTSDIASVIQEIVNRDGWNAGNHLRLIFEPDVGNTGFHNVRTNNNGIGLLPILYTRVKRYIQGVQHLDGRPEYTARDELLRTIRDLRVNMYTPMLGSQFEAAKYMLGREVDHGLERGGSYKYSIVRVSHPDSYTGGSVVTPPNCNSADPWAIECLKEKVVADGTEPVTYTSPMLDSCQSNHMVLLGDGHTHTFAQAKIRNLTDSSCTGVSCGVELSSWLNTNDHALDIDGDQNITTHTVAFNLSGNANATQFYSNIANASGTVLKQADSAAELVSVFSSIIDSVTSIDTGFTSPGATVNQFNRLSHREDVYFTMFKPAETTVWGGNLKRYELGEATTSPAVTSTEFLDADGNAVVDPDTGFFKATARSFWQNINDDGEQINTADGANVLVGGAAVRIGVNGIDSRKLYTYIGDSVPQDGVALADGSHNLHEDNELITATMLGVSDAAREELLKWVRGLDRLDIDADDDVDEPRRRMGDPLHSSPVIVNYPAAVTIDAADADPVDTADAEEVSEQAAAAADNSLVFVSTNEGVLHAIESKTGNERWAFSPQELMQNHKAFYANSSLSSRPYGLDGTLTLWRDEQDDDLVIDSANNESAYVFVGMRRGGNNYYALDVSDKDEPRLQWVIKGGPGGTAGFEELGQSWSDAKHARMNIEGAVKDVLIFGGGYDTNQDADPLRGADGNTVVMEHTEDSIGRAIFIVDASTGDLLWTARGPDSGLGETSAPDLRLADMTYSIPAGVRVVDINADGLVDQLYASDTGGQLWRFDVTGDGSTNSALMQGGVLARFSDSDANKHRRFYNEPDVALVKENNDSFLTISIGSGWRAHPLNDIVDDALYVIRSSDVRNVPDGYGREITEGYWAPITEADLVQVNGASNDDTADYTLGWYLRLPDAGEKVLGNSVTFQNTVYFTSYVPSPDTMDCSANLGGGYVYALSVIDGKPVLDFNGDGSIDEVFTEGTSNDMRIQVGHSGVPPQPAVFIGENKQAEVFVGAEGVPTSTSNLTTRTFWVDSGD